VVFLYFSRRLINSVINHLSLFIFSTHLLHFFTQPYAVISSNMTYILFMYLTHLTSCHCVTVYINLLKPSSNFTYNQVLTLKNSTWCPHCVYVFCTDLRTNSNFCLIHHQLNGLVTAMESVYCAVHSESLYETHNAWFLKG
jgi:hypothetical protein